MRKLIALPAIVIMAALLFAQCNDAKTEPPVIAKEDFNGFGSQVKWGEHLVTVSGCHDCHSPKKMTPQGMEIDSARMLSGYDAGWPEPDVNKKELQSKGVIATSDLTAWIGPWGTSYTANLTPDATGIGNWKEDQFMLALRKGKSKGLEGSRDLLPPMPWQMYRNFTDDEIKAVFAYLLSLPPVKNVVPAPLPPAAR